MKAGLIGGSSVQRSVPFDSERSVNLFPVLDQKGKDVASLYGKPGLKLLATAGSGPGRGAYTASNGRVFIVSGNILYELLSDNSTVSRGTLNLTQNLVTMDENGFQLAICDGQSLYIFTYATNAFVRVNTANLPSAATVTFIDGYFVVNRVNSGIFQISALYDGLTWAALDFATAESSPDNLLCVKNVSGQLWLVGTKTNEIYSNTGGAKFPFTRINGAKLDKGTIAPYSVLALDNSIFWVGRDENGAGIVYRAQGFSPQRVSIEPVELKIQAAPNPESLKSYAYQEDGHTFLAITGGGLETSQFLDLATNIWHERAFLNMYGLYEQDLVAMTTYGFNKIIAIDRSNGNIYEQSLKYNNDNGEEIVRDRIFTHLFDENQRFIIKNLVINFEMGLSAQGQDAQCTVSLSRDGGKTWSGGYKRSIGKAGEYLRRSVFQRLGQYRQCTFRVRVTDSVPVRMTGAEFNVN